MPLPVRNVARLQCFFSIFLTSVQNSFFPPSEFKSQARRPYARFITTVFSRGWMMMIMTTMMMMMMMKIMNDIFSL